MNLKVSLRILALFFWWYLVVFVLSIAPLLGISLPIWFTPEFRGQSYAWDFELMFTAIFFVWGYFLWRAATQPLEHRSFILFSIWATVAHIAAMLVVGLIRVEDFQHLLTDAAALSVPLLLVAQGYKKAFPRIR